MSTEIGKENHIVEIFDVLEQYRKKGRDITADIYLAPDGAKFSLVQTKKDPADKYKIDYETFVRLFGDLLS